VSQKIVVVFSDFKGSACGLASYGVPKGCCCVFGFQGPAASHPTVSQKIVVVFSDFKASYGVSKGCYDFLSVNYFVTMHSK